MDVTVPAAVVPEKVEKHDVIKGPYLPLRLFN